MNPDPKPISEAPRDGTVVLSDCGLVMYLNQRDWGSPVPNGKWALCTPSGDTYHDEDGIILENPTLWVALPKWVK